MTFVPLQSKGLTNTDGIIVITSLEVGKYSLYSGNGGMERLEKLSQVLQEIWDTARNRTQASSGLENGTALCRDKASLNTRQNLLRGSTDCKKHPRAATFLQGRRSNLVTFCSRCRTHILICLDKQPDITV